MVLRRFAILGCEIFALLLSLGVGVFGQTATPRSTPLMQRSFAQPPVLPSPGDWSQFGKLGPGPGGFTIFFASAVAESGDTIVVGTQADVSNSRAAYIFVKPARGWMNAFLAAALSIPAP